jgi:hypothetical protein
VQCNIINLNVCWLQWLVQNGRNVLLRNTVPDKSSPTALFNLRLDLYASGNSCLLVTYSLRLHLVAYFCRTGWWREAAVSELCGAANA